MCAFRISFGFLLFAVVLLTGKIVKVEAECTRDSDCSWPNYKCCHTAGSAWGYCKSSCPSPITSPAPTISSYCFNDNECPYSFCCYSRSCSKCRTCYHNYDCRSGECCPDDKCIESFECTTPITEPVKLYVGTHKSCTKDWDCSEDMDECCSSDGLCSTYGCGVTYRHRFPAWAIALIVFGLFLMIVLPVAGIHYWRSPSSHARGYQRTLAYPTSNVVPIPNQVQTQSAAPYYRSPMLSNYTPRPSAPSTLIM